MNATNLEPAERDHKAIRRTVLALITMMVVGGCVIFWKYTQYQKEQQKEVELGRAPQISRLTKTFAGRCQDGVSRELSMLEGKVWVVAPIVPQHPHENEVALRHMKQLAELYKDNPNFHLVCLSVANPREQGYEKLAEVADSVGADLDQWWFMAADEESVIGYLKDHLKMAHISERKGEEAEKLGRWDIPAQLRIVDQSRRVRGDHEQFDFDFAKAREEQTAKEIEQNPELANEPLAGFYLNMRERWNDRMLKVIDYTLEETEGDEDPDYNTAILVTCGILGFIIFQGIRLRKRVNG